MFVVPIAIALCSIGILNSILKIVEKQIHHNTRIKKITVNINQIDYYFDCNVEEADSIYNLAIEFCTEKGQSFGFTVDSFDQCTRPLIAALQKGHNYNGMLPFKIHFVYKHNNQEAIQQYINKEDVENKESITNIDTSINDQLYNYSHNDVSNAVNIESSINDVVPEDKAILVEVNNQINEIINTDENNMINSRYIVESIDNNNNVNLNIIEEISNSSNSDDDNKVKDSSDYTNNNSNDNTNSNDNSDNNINNNDNTSNSDNNNVEIQSIDNNSTSTVIDKTQIPLEINGITYIFEYIPTNDINILKVDANKLAESFCILHGLEILNEHPLIKNKIELTNKEFEKLLYNECYQPLADAIYNTMIL